MGESQSCSTSHQHPPHLFSFIKRLEAVNNCQILFFLNSGSACILAPSQCWGLYFTNQLTLNKGSVVWLQNSLQTLPPLLLFHPLFSLHSSFLPDWKSIFDAMCFGSQNWFIGHHSHLLCDNMLFEAFTPQTTWLRGKNLLRVHETIIELSLCENVSLIGDASKI